MPYEPNALQAKLVLLSW